MFIKKGWSLSINKKYRRLKKWNQDTPTFNTYLDDTHKEHIISDHALNVILKHLRNFLTNIPTLAENYYFNILNNFIGIMYSY